MNPELHYKKGADDEAAAPHDVIRRPAGPPHVDILDLHPPAADVRTEVLAGLTRPQKSLPCKFFYDARGSRLFDAICGLSEYYPTRTELEITRAHAADIAALLGPQCLLVEYGSGSSTKTRLLLDELRDPAGYVPIDISCSALADSAAALAAAYPALTIRPVCADYTKPFDLPKNVRPPRSVAAYFPGSTVGNFEPDEAAAFLRGVRRTCGVDSVLLIGVDLKKDPAVLHAAYNDAGGVTAAFNRNVLRRVNRDLGAAFDESAFDHYAFYNVPAGRMEMHLVSRRTQRVALGAGASVTLAEGESIHTENCYKYTVPSFTALATQAGYAGRQVWTDAADRFSVHLLAAD